MALRTPSSQKLSLRFAFVEVRSRKKARMRAMVPTMMLNSEKRSRDELRVA